MLIKQFRRNIINEIDKSEDKEKFFSDNANNLFNLGLTMYSKNNTIDSLIFNAFNKSFLNPNFSLHEEQTKIINLIEDNRGCIVSAPTSFGKTFCIFEYIAKHQPKNVVLIVPTLALAKEYIDVFLKTYPEKFNDYLLYTSVDDSIQYDFANNKNIFVLTHEKASTNLDIAKLEKIDFLVIDEVYKLDKSRNDDRTLIFNVAYNLLSKKSEKYVLLAPFVKRINNIETLEKEPAFFASDFSPVANFVETINIQKDSERFTKPLVLLKECCKGEKTLIYFTSPSDTMKFVKFLENYPLIKQNNRTEDFLKWARAEIYPEWYVVKALEKGFLIHNGGLPLGIRNFLLSIFNDKESNNDCLLCTSTLLEGVNTSAKYLIITKSKYQSMKFGNVFSAFDFYNLVGRTGRLMQYYTGKTYYLKSNEDPQFNEEDANVSITFEITEKTKDIDIQINRSCNDNEVISYLKNIGISIDEYVDEIGTPIRFEAFKEIRNNYLENKEKMLSSIDNLNNFETLRSINNIVSSRSDPKRYGLINKVLQSSNRCVKDIVNEIKDLQAYKNTPIDTLIADILKIKYSYLEHSFLGKLNIIKLFLKKENADEKYIKYINEQFISNIEQMYFLNEPYKKMLKSIGIYERDIDKITNIIGRDYVDIKEMKERLVKYKDEISKVTSIVSVFAIESIM